MLFNSLSYFLFFPVVVGIYFALPHRHRWLLLLLASYTFYMFWRVEYAILMLTSTAVDYFVAIKMAVTPPQQRKKYLAISLVSNLGLLFAFKYLGFALTSVNLLLQPFHIAPLPAIDWLLPVGISFYTFQTLSYTLDVYRGKIEPEQHFGMFAVYVSFFPQLVAGPIERAGRLLPQFRSPQKLNYVRIVHGMRRILIGLFKKVVVADFLAHYVDLIYCRPEDFAGSAVILASIFFAFQIYCDFAGYTDIAIGSAQVLGIRLGENFRGPYLARSLGEFWRRWHISLSTWFRDYVYLPLGGNRGFWAILVVFLLSGLWHGANWTYVLWGLLHGMLLLLETKLKPWSKKLGRIFGSGMQRLLTFSAVTALWVIFRAENLAQARLLFSKMLHPGSWSLSTLDIMGNRFDFFLSLILIGGLLGADFAAEKMPFADRLAQWPRAIRWAVYYAMIFILLIVGINSQRPFMYFQF